MLAYLASRGLASAFLNSRRERKLQYETIKRGQVALSQQKEHQEAITAFVRFVQSLFDKEYDPAKIQQRQREISYSVSDAMTISYDYSSYYLLIKAYLETKDLPKETLRSRIIGEDPLFSQVFMSIPYDAICIALPPSCQNDKRNVTGIINRMQSVLAEYTESSVEQ